jgi:hypothetical protein
MWKNKSDENFKQQFPVKLMIDQKQLQNVNFLKYLCNMLTNDGSCTCEIKSRIAMKKTAFNKKRSLFTNKMALELRNKLVKCCIWGMLKRGRFGQ